MNIIGEYSINYNIYTMFNVYSVSLKDHNLITDKGYEFFLQKWYQDKNAPFELGYLYENKFYAKRNVNGTYSEDLADNGGYKTSTNYIDRASYKQYKFDGENFVDFNEKLDKICLGNITYKTDDSIQPKREDIKLYAPLHEYEVENFERKSTSLLLKCNLDNTKINGTTEIGVKTNHGRLVSHDIHPPYNIPFGTNITLEYEFKLK